jgi:DNA-directed RNA polymerase subunit beta'
MCLTAKFLDDIKTLGFRMAFRGGLSFNINDLIIPEIKEPIIRKCKVK